ncbi:MAG TPA: kelch repeat-containing protein [Acidimicrobiales bacterium]|nr:kelch repeat-containing protein [Acidimicrobiales bacterium]
MSTSAIYRVTTSGGGGRVGSLARAVHDAGGAMLGSQALVFGGGAASTVATVQSWSSSGASVAGSLPAARSDLAVAVSGSTAYVVGGFDGTAMAPAVLATTDGRTFRVVADLVQPVRYPAVALTGHDLWVIGGVTGTSEGATETTDDIQRVDLAKGSTAIVGHLPAAMGHAAGFSLDGRVYVAGGRTGTTPVDGVLLIDPSTGRASQVATLPGPRSDAAAVVVGATAYVLGGEESGPTHPLTSVVEISSQK